MRNLTLIILLTIITFKTKGQAYESKRLDDPKGYRLKPSGNDRIIYLSDVSTKKPIKTASRALNSTVYFTKVVDATIEQIDGKDYIQIRIPGNCKLPAGENLTDIKFSGKLISAIDYDHIFWIEKSEFDDVNVSYKRYRNDWVFCALTIPFKYRPSVGNRAPDLIDGSFNIGPAIGFKVRLSEERPFFVCPVISGGIANLNYTSANNDAITDPQKTQSGMGLQYGGGIVFDFYKIQFGAIFGADHSLGDIGKTFVYNNNLWFGASLSFNFLTNKIDVGDKTGNK